MFDNDCHCRPVVFASLIALFAVFSDPVVAQPSAPAAGDWRDLPVAARLLDAPLRKTLEDAGVSLEASFVTDLLGNPVGGRRQGFAYIGGFQASLSADLERLSGWRGAEFVIGMADTSGTDLSSRMIGNDLGVAEVVAIPTVVCSQLFIRQSLANDTGFIKFGRFSAGDDFATLDMFQLYTGAINPVPPALESDTFFSTPPASSWAAVLRMEISPGFHLQAGAFQSTDAVDVALNHGLDLRFGAGDGLLLLAEAAYEPEFAGSSGEYRFGSYWDSRRQESFSAAGEGVQPFGFYAIGQQQVWRESPKSKQGLTAWYALTLSPQQEVSQFPFSASLGAGWQGLLPGRDEDWILFGTWMVSTSRAYATGNRESGEGNDTFEWVLEWDYRAQLTPWLYVMPDVQWVVRPGAGGSVPNALVVGAEIGVIF